LIVALGTLGLLSPPRIVAIARHFQTSAGLYFAGAVRLVMGAALFFAAPDSRAPEILRILGLVIIVAGLVTPFFGLERYQRLVDWWSAQGPVLVRAQALFALVLGLLLTYALVP
jgi:hypothetical protein